MRPPPLDEEERDTLEDDDERDAPEFTARPSERTPRELTEAENERLVPVGNVGGAAPTTLGLDSGGNGPEAEDDLSNLPEPEPPVPPELDAVHVREDEEEGEPRTRH